MGGGEALGFMFQLFFSRSEVLLSRRKREWGSFASGSNWKMGGPFSGGGGEIPESPK